MSPVVLELVSLLLAAHMGHSIRLIAVEMAFEKTPAIPRYRRTKNLTLGLLLLQLLCYANLYLVLI
jgi:hypothetical protein